MMSFRLPLLISIATIFITLAYPAFGQQDNASLSKNELGISLLSYASRPSSNILFDKTFHAHSFRGISYKRHIGQSAVRLAVARQQLSKRQPVPENWTSEGDYEATIIKVGWERSFTSGRLSPYAATDVIGIKSFANGSAGGGIVGTYHDFEVDRLGLGLSPTLGFRYRPLRWLSVFAETSLDIIYSRYRGDYVRIWPEAPNPRFANDTAGFEGKFNPLSTLVINVTF